jgi:hypothetical protein
MTELKWYRGSLHNHTNRSDGDSDPEEVADWYCRNGYDFIVFTDHNRVTMLEDDARQDFLVIPGEEVSLRINDGETAIHINAIGIEKTVEPIQRPDAASALQENVDAIRKVGGIAAINHPNYTWAFDHNVLKQVSGAKLLEVHNSHPVVNTYGGAGRPSCEEIWDGVLSSGRPIWGIATDDSHHFQGDFTPRRGNPGRGWVMVRASRLDRGDILGALCDGDFYASNGVALRELAVGKERVALEVEQERDFVYAVEFTGREGRHLQQTYGLSAEYRPRGDEGYIRATVKCSDGTKAWTQPMFVG